MTGISHRNLFPGLWAARGLVVGAEVGVYRGGFSEVILAHPGINRLYSVDAWADSDGNPMTDVIEECRGRLARFGERSEMVQCSSVEGAARFADGALDFVYIDAAHDYDSIMQDIGCWAPKVRPGGCVAGHDYSNKGKSLVREMVTEAHPSRGRKRGKQAVDDWVESYEHELWLTGDRPHSWYVWMK